MGFLKELIKKFSCNSNCKFNNDIFDSEILNDTLNQYTLKNKDIIKIGSILKKRKRNSKSSIRTRSNYYITDSESL